MVLKHEGLVLVGVRSEPIANPPGTHGTIGSENFEFLYSCTWNVLEIYSKFMDKTIENTSVGSRKVRRKIIYQRIEY